MTQPDHRARIVAAINHLHDTGGVYALDAGEPERIADAVLAVLPATVLPAPDQQAVLTDHEKAMLGFALEMAQEEIYARSLEFTDEDRAALERLRRLAGEARQDPAQDGTAVVDHRQFVEYFVQAQQPGGSWEQCSSTAPDREFATERIAARRRMHPEFIYRIAERTTTVVVRSVAEDTAVGRSGQPETDQEAFCDFGVTDTPGSGCILLAGHEPANRHIVTPGDTDDD